MQHEFPLFSTDILSLSCYVEIKFPCFTVVYNQVADSDCPGDDLAELAETVEECQLSCRLVLQTKRQWMNVNCHVSRYYRQKDSG